MTKRQKKKAEKLKREAIHEMLDLALDINGLQASKRDITGDHPTTFLYMSGHVGKIRVDVHPHGWEPDEGPDKRLSVETYMDGACLGGLTLSGAVQELRRTKAMLEKRGYESFYLGE